MSLASLDCPHQDAPAAARMCEHLVGDPSLAHVRRFTGIGRVFDLVCVSCADEGHDALEDRLGFVCADCFAGVQQTGIWSPEPGILGAPEVVERSLDLFFTHEMVRMPQALGPIVDLQPIGRGPEPVILALLASGRLVRIDLAARSRQRLLSVALEPGAEGSLVVDPAGGFAAIVATRGRRGLVVDIGALGVTMELDRGEPDGEPGGEHASDFPVAFVERGGRTLMVHAVSPSRLDVSDPRTGELLTGRDLGDRPPSYVHGGLLPGPGSEWIADNGFVDGPAGFVSAWSVRRWLEDDLFESEHGASRKYFDQRWYFWDGPLCWLDQRTLAIWGYGPAEECLLDAVLLYDVEAGVMIDWFPGPRGRLAFDQYLFSTSDDLGTSVWDPDTGELVHRDPGFHPQRYHGGARRFVTAQPDGEFFVVSRLVSRS